MPLNFFTSNLRLSDAIFSDDRAGIRRQPIEYFTVEEESATTKPGDAA